MSSIIKFPRRGRVRSRGSRKANSSRWRILRKLVLKPRLYITVMPLVCATPAASPWHMDTGGVQGVRRAASGRVVAVVGKVPGAGLQWRIDLGLTTKYGQANSFEEAMSEADTHLRENGWVLA